MSCRRCQSALPLPLPPPFALAGRHKVAVGRGQCQAPAPGAGEKRLPLLPGTALRTRNLEPMLLRMQLLSLDINVGVAYVVAVGVVVVLGLVVVHNQPAFYCGGRPPW